MAILNSTLPPDIRVLGWATVGPDFSARFNCCEKTYKYFFPRGFLNLEVSLSAITARRVAFVLKKSWGAPTVFGMVVFKDGG